jgi:hypothetical protein
MKPEHFRKTEPLGNCGKCAHICWILDQEKHICRKHAFTLINTMAHIMNDHVCDDFAIVAKPARRSVLDVLGDSPYPTLCDEPRTLVIENAFVESSSMTDSSTSVTPRITGRIDGYCKGTHYAIQFQATDVLVEDV